ncbi:hypothetical protein M6B38_130115 [Iris pallida]|uniref:C2H2-type domain-containing protein n=1 Tax=Iris pallida TaxID=29817 RepID=A0AAX6G6N2_IRIPA|nr:hypothetical protein M6B38_130115 [Iris pallida]
MNTCRALSRMFFCYYGKRSCAATYAGEAQHYRIHEFTRFCARDNDSVFDFKEFDI